MWFVSSFVQAATPPVTGLAFSPGNESVVAISQSGLDEYDWPELKLRRNIASSAANLHCLAFSPTGMHLAVGGGNPSEDGTVEVFSWPAGKLVATLKGHTDSVRSVVWRSASHLVSAGVDHDIRLWDIESKTALLRTLKGHSAGVSSLCLLNDGVTLVSAGDDQSVRVWNLESGDLIRNLNQHTGKVHALAVLPGRTGLPMVASAAADRTIRIWQPTIGRMVRYVRLDAEPLSLVWLNDSRIAASATDGRLHIIDALNVKVLQSDLAIDGWAYSVAISPGGKSVLVGGSRGRIQEIRTLSPGP